MLNQVFVQKGDLMNKYIHIHWKQYVANISCDAK